MGGSHPLHTQIQTQTKSSYSSKENRQEFRITLNINPLSAKFTKWSNTLKQFVGKLRIADEFFECLTILWEKHFILMDDENTNPLMHNVSKWSDTL